MAAPPVVVKSKELAGEVDAKTTAELADFPGAVVGT
jgi:hypothetical protein